MDVSALYGLWDFFSGPLHGEVTLQENGTFLLAVFAGAQHTWGTWAVEDRGAQNYLIMNTTGANPPTPPMQMGQPIPQEVHAILNVQPNQIQLFDSLLVRRLIAHAPLPMPQPGLPSAGDPGRYFMGGPALHAAAVGVPGTAPNGSSGAGPAQQAAYQSMPPQLYQGPSHPMPPATAAPPQHMTPAMAQMLQHENEVNNQVRAIYAQIDLDTRQTNMQIESGNAALADAQTREYQMELIDSEKQSSEMSDRFTQYLRGR